MKIGTKSVLFGAHCAALHWFFVALGWWKLYGWRPVQVNDDNPKAVVSLWHPWLWIAFLVHDIGYLGKPNMDGEEGELHPWTGARLLYRLQGWWLYVTGYAWRDTRADWARTRLWEQRRRLAIAHLMVGHQPVIWGNEVLFHSRFLAKRYGARPSRLCLADKLAITLEPWWLYLPRVNLTGEVREYMAKSSAMNGTGNKYSGMNLDISSQRAWHRDMCDYIRRWVAEHRDGREDTWTPSTKAVSADVVTTAA
jgi:hypothetical protein